MDRAAREPGEPAADKHVRRAKDKVRRRKGKDRDRKVLVREVPAAKEARVDRCAWAAAVRWPTCSNAGRPSVSMN